MTETEKLLQGLSPAEVTQVRRIEERINHASREHHLETLCEGLKRYALQGVEPGSFLQAVLRGDLFDAVRRADIINKAKLFLIVQGIQESLPAGSFGYPVVYDNWVQTHGLIGRCRETSGARDRLREAAQKISNGEVAHN